MDVPEGSKHGKKSTSQKLEDQKKVGKLPCFLFFLPVLLQNALLSSSAVCECVFCFFKNDQLWLLLVSSCMYVETKG